MAAPELSHSLAVVNLGFRRGMTEIFAGLNFAAKSGEFLQVQGANGSGKTSLLRILAGLANPDVGQVLWNTQNIHALTAHEFRAASFFIGHRNGVSSDLNTYENLTFARQIFHGDVQLDIERACDTLGVAFDLNVPAGKLSAGQRQRIALAKLCVIDAPVWLLDEPLTALDSDGKSRVEALITGHCRAGGMVIAATHQALKVDSVSTQTLAL